jgi:hypothetical protein
MAPLSDIGFQPAKYFKSESSRVGSLFEIVIWSLIRKRSSWQWEYLTLNALRFSGGLAREVTLNATR